MLESKILQLILMEERDDLDPVRLFQYSCFVNLDKLALMPDLQYRIFVGRKLFEGLFSVWIALPSHEFRS